MDESLKVAGYLRIDGGEETSIECRKSLFEERLRSHEGWEYVDLYFDNAPGSKTCPRPGLQRLVADCEAGKINLIVTNNLTTLYRDTSEALQLIWELQMLSPPVHIRLESAGIDTRNPQQLLFCMVFNYVIQEKRAHAADSQKEKEAVGDG